VIICAAGCGGAGSCAVLQGKVSTHCDRVDLFSKITNVAELDNDCAGTSRDREANEFRGYLSKQLVNLIVVLVCQRLSATHLHALDWSFILRQYYTGG